MRRAGVEVMIWSSRLILPAALAGHLVVSWTALGVGVLGGILTLVAPGLGELVWLVLLPWGGAASFAALAVVLTLAALIAILFASFRVMDAGSARRRTGAHARQDSLASQAKQPALALPDQE